MNWSPELSNIRDILAGLYSATQSIVRIVDDSGLNPTFIEWNGAPIDVWHKILKYADYQGKVQVIINVALKDYPDNDGLKQAILLACQQKSAKPEAHTPKRLSWNDEVVALRYEKPNFPWEVYENEPITVKGTIGNVGSVPIPLKSVVIAVRPPLGRIEEGPFRYDFAVYPQCTVNPGEILTFCRTKAIEIHDGSGLPQEIPDRYIDEDWFGFMACQTEDCVWRNDTSKSPFVVRMKR